MKAPEAQHEPQARKRAAEHADGERPQYAVYAAVGGDDDTTQTQGHRVVVCDRRQQPR